MKKPRDRRYNTVRWRRLRARLEAAVGPYRTPAGLDFPGVSLLASGRRA